MHIQTQRQASILFWVGTLYLAFSCIPAVVMPSHFSDENGPVELAQNLVLLVGFLASLIFMSNSQGQQKALWIFAASMFFIAFWRELSWGAAIYAMFHPEIDPNTVSSRILWYRPAVTPLIVLTAAFGLYHFIRAKAWALASTVKQKRAIPLRELFVLVISVAVSTAAEGKLGLSLPFDSDARLNLEELSELAAYFMLVAASFRIRAALRPADQ